MRMGQRGASLVEAMIAAAILVIAVAGISLYLTQSRDFAIKVEGAAGCKSDAESLLLQFADSSNMQIANYIPGVGGTRTLTGAGTEQNYYTAVTGTAGANPQYRNYQNIENSVTRANILFRNNALYCSTAGGLTVTAGMSANVFSNTNLYNSVIAKNKTVLLSIRPVNLSDGSFLNCNTTDVSPLSTENTTLARGLFVEMRVRNNLTNEECRASTTLKYTADVISPTNSTVLNVVNCGVSGTLASSEPGSLFECQINAGAYSLCHNIAGYSSTITLTSAANQPTAATFNLVGFPDGATTVGVRTLDTAGNRSTGAPVSAVVNCCTDTVWLPPASTCCLGAPCLQMSNCGNTRTVIGTSTIGACACTPVACQGSWGACLGGFQTYTVTIPASCGGAACPFATGDTQVCVAGCPPNCDCIGSWSACSGCPGVQTYTVTTPATGTGAACPANTGDTQACGGTPVNCEYTWSACNTSTGQRTINISQPAACGGTACPASPQNCAVDCVGSWSACGVPYGNYRTYSVTTPALNGGAACGNFDGDMWNDPSCSTPFQCFCTDGTMLNWCPSYINLGAAGGIGCTAAEQNAFYGTSYTDCFLSRYRFTATFENSDCNNAPNPPVFGGAQCVQNGYDGSFIQGGFGPCSSCCY